MASLVRTASIAGFVALVGILTTEVVVPTAVTGANPISGTVDRDTIAAYYAHPGLEWALGFGLFVIVLPAFLLFAVTIRELAAEDRQARYPATIGLAFAVVAVPVYVMKAAIATAIVALVGSGLDPVPLFRVYDLAYNGAIYPLEAAYVLGLGLGVAALGTGAPGLRRLSIAVAAIQLLNSLVLFVGLPNTVALPGNIAFAVWLGATSIALWRMAPAAATQPVASPA
jgi:hypothetical protein